MKTALERIFEKYDKEFDKMNFLRWLSDNRKSLLEDEKEQIWMAFNDGKISAIVKNQRTPEEYYNLTFKSDE